MNAATAAAAATATPTPTRPDPLDTAIASPKLRAFFIVDHTTNLLPCANTVLVFAPDELLTHPTPHLRCPAATFTPTPRTTLFKNRTGRR